MSNDVEILLNSVKNFKHGWKTSEFWVTLSPVVVAILSVFGVGVTSNALTQTLTIVWGAVAAVYVASRTLAKTVHIGHAANLSVVLKQIEQDAEQAGKDIVKAPEGQKTTTVVPTEPDVAERKQLIARSIEDDVAKPVTEPVTEPVPVQTQTPPAPVQTTPQQTAPVTEYRHPEV